MTTTDSNTSRARSGATNATGLSSIDAMRKLLNDQTLPNDRRSLLGKLGLAQEGNTKAPRTKSRITDTHTLLAEHFMAADIILDTPSEELIMKSLSIMESETNVKLNYLLAKGNDMNSILHTILGKSTYMDDDDEDQGQGKGMVDFDFERIKPFVNFLLRLYPELPMMVDYRGRTPLHAILDDSSDYLRHDPETNGKIIQYLCGGDGLRTQKAIESLSHADGTSPDHAIHKAIKTDVRISEQILKASLEMSKGSGRKSDKDSCFEVADSDGRTVRIFYLLSLPSYTALRVWGVSSL